MGNKEIKTPPMKKVTEAVRATSEKPKQMAERTPPRVRRLSIENSSYTALEKSTNHDDRRAAKTPTGKPKEIERTPPPRARRLSIENGTAITAGVSMNHEEKKGAKTPSTNTRSRRLSLEGPRNVQKDSNHLKSPEPITKISKPEVRSLQHHSPLEQRAPRSPINYSLTSPMIKTDTAKVRMLPLQTPKTPELQIKARNETQRPLPTDRGLSQTPCTTHSKRSQIRKSLRTIGKFINGSEKR